MRKFVSLLLLQFLIVIAIPFSVFAQTIIATVGVENYPFGVAANPNTNRIYVTNRGSGSVSVIDGAASSVIATVSVEGSPRGVAVNPNTNRIYVANNKGRSVSVIDGSSNSVISTIYLAGYPFGVAVNPNTNLIYVSSHETNTVEVIDGSTNTVINSIPLAIGGQFTLGVNPNSNRVFVATSGTLFIIDAYANQIVSTLPVGPAAAGRGANSVAVNSTTNRVYVANFNGNTVSVIQDFVNQPPTVNAGGPYSVDEGGTVQVAATGQDPENGPLTYAWDLDNNGSFETPGQTVTFSAASIEGPNTRTIGVQVTDNGNLSATDEATVNILALIDFYLHGTGPVNNPPTLFLDDISPTSATEKYRDSALLELPGIQL